MLIPIAIGLGVAGYMLYREWDPEAFGMLTFTWYVLFFIVVSFVMMVLRDLGYMLRLWLLSDGAFTLRQCFNIIMLWEFTSAITPSAIGGTAFAIFFVHKEGVSVGKSTAVVMATSFLDELYFIFMFPLMFLVVSGSDLFTFGNAAIEGEAVSFANKYFYFAFVGYGMKLIWVLLMGYALFFNPKAVKNLLVGIFKFKLIRRWQPGVVKMGDDLIVSSLEMKTKTFKFWLKAFLSTILSWSARYWIVNFLLVALILGIPESTGGVIDADATGASAEIPDYTFSTHILIFARQLVMWIMMLVMPTPGGTGFAEAVFSEYMADFIPVGFVALMALLWRVVTYYPYLFMGAIVIPRWVKRIYSKGKEIIQPNN